MEMEHEHEPDFDHLWNKEVREMLQYYLTNPDPAYDKFRASVLKALNSDEKVRHDLSDLRLGGSLAIKTFFPETDDGKAEEESDFLRQALMAIKEPEIKGLPDPKAVNWKKLMKNWFPPDIDFTVDVSMNRPDRQVNLKITLSRTEQGA